MNFLYVPTILFMAIVAPLWIIMHYRSKGKAAQGLKEDERVVMEEMLETIDKLADRVNSLERILDKEQPQWREHRSRANGN